MVGSFLVKDGGGNPIYLQAGTGNGTQGNPYIPDHNVVNVVSVTGTITVGAITPGVNVIGKVGLQVGGTDVSTSNTVPIKLVDPNNSNNVAEVAAFHQSDNQILGATFGLLTGGVAQLVNPTGNLDRQRETGFDNIPSVGISTGTQQLAGPIMATTTTSSVTGVGTPQAVPLSAVSFTNRGITSTIQPGTSLMVDPGLGTQEIVFITAVSGNNVTGIFTKNHINGAVAQAFSYNQARDSTIPDGTLPIGIAANATFFWNPTLNAGTGGLEIERSAAGELDGATGSGMNSAAEYEWNGGGPVSNTGVVSGLQFDRARNLQAKGTGSTTLNGSTLAGAASVIVTAVGTLKPGVQIRLDRNTGTEETAYIATNWNGTTTVTLQSNLQFAHANASTVEWDQFSSVGPGLNGFTATGIGIEEEAIFNALDGKYYIERSATADAMAPANVVAESPVLWNGSGMDRMRTPNIFKTVATLTTGSTALWTPAAGKKFRLMRYKIIVTYNSASAANGIVTIDLLDSATTFGNTHSVFIQTTALTTGGPALYDSGWVNLGNGYLSTTNNNVLNINLSAALTAGTVRVIACGIEE